MTFATDDVLLVLVALAWGSTYLGAKVALASLSVFTLLFLRFGAAGLLTLPLAGRDLRTVRGRALGASALLGLLLATSIIVETRGILETSPANAGVLISLTILLVPLVERFFSTELPLLALAPPALLSVVGCALLALRGDLHVNPGDGLVLLAAATRAVHLVASKRLPGARGASPAAVSVVQFCVVAVVCGIAAASSGHLAPDVATASPRIWAVVLFLAVVCTVFAFYVQLRAVRRMPAARVGLLLGLEPVFAALLGALSGADALSPRRWAGVALIVAATYWGRRLADRSARASRVASEGQQELLDVASA